MNLLVVYPIEFKSYSKFHRKLENILSSEFVQCVFFYQDSNGFINKYFSEKSPNTKLFENYSWDNKVSHAIIFDDGEEFPEIATKLKNSGTPTRKIRISITRVINIKADTQYAHLKSTPNYEYIGRGSYWGNPYSMYESGDSREEVIRKFKYDFDFDKFPNKKKSEVYKLAGKRLGCFCKPKACHGDILADFLNSWDDDQ